MREIKRKRDLWAVIGHEPCPPRTSWPEFRTKVPPPTETELQQQIRRWNYQGVHQVLTRQKNDNEAEIRVDKGLPVGGFWETPKGKKIISNKEVLLAACESILATL